MSYKSYTQNRIRRLTNKVKECRVEISNSLLEIRRLEHKLEDMEEIQQCSTAICSSCENFKNGACTPHYIERC